MLVHAAFLFCLLHVVVSDLSEVCVLMIHRMCIMLLLLGSENVLSP